MSSLKEKIYRKLDIIYENDLRPFAIYLDYYSYRVFLRDYGMYSSFTSTIENTPYFCGTPVYQVQSKGEHIAVSI